jgi:hypothetical protein
MQFYGCCFHAYVRVDANALALICVGYSNAVAIEVDDSVGESLEPDATRNVHARPIWSHVLSGAKPPKDIFYLITLRTLIVCRLELLVVP